MKADAPEKIYLQEPTKVRTEKKYDNDIEYIRTDTFIEKACEWIKEKWDADYTMPIIIDSVIENFKQYVELNKCNTNL